MIVNHIKKWVYIGPPKTGSTAISYVLTDGKYNTNEFIQDSNVNFKGIEINGQHTPWPPNKLGSKYDDYNVFISVRNPFSRIVSLYDHWKYGQNYENELFFKEKTLEEFMHLVLDKNLSNDGFFHTTITDWVTRYDFFIKQESLENDLKMLNIHSIDFNVPLINEKLGSTKHWKEEHNKKTIEMTIEWAEKDFYNFEYSKDINV
jgi:hypothetical protein